MNSTKEHEKARESYGKLIKANRESLKLSQETFAEALEISKSYLARIEKGDANFSTDMHTRINFTLKNLHNLHRPQ